jgi:hypothetical protein
VPNVIVDGKGTSNTVLTLSHWPKSGTPAALSADTSTAIVFKYLDSPAFHTAADAVSNNHFDEDGLVGIFVLLEPALAKRHRDLLIDVAQAGDFGVFERREAARIAFVLAAYGDAARSPLPGRVFERPYSELVAELHVRLFEVVPRLLTGIDAFRSMWEHEDAQMAESEKAIATGLVAIEEQHDLDFAVVRVPEGVAACHPFALHSRTDCTRLLLIHGQQVELQYRYEGWVQMASRRPAARVDLTALANELNQEETSGGTWVFDGVDEITPRLHILNSSVTAIPPDVIRQRAVFHLQNCPPAWNPYD